MKRFFAIAIVLTLFSKVAFAQDLSPMPPRPPREQGPDLATRLNQLEAETQALRAEVVRLREQPVRLPTIDAVPPPAEVPATPAATVVTAPAAVQQPEEDIYTMDEIRGEMKKMAWKKGEFSIVPYGWLWGNMPYSTQRTTPGSYTLYAQSATLQPESEFFVDARNTRLGFDVGGPRIPLFDNAVSGGKVEIDFQNSAVNASENRSTVLLRHAYAEVKNDEYRLLAGQTWDIISPLNPGMLMYSVGWDGGNIGYRRAQFRGERYFSFSDTSMVTTQLSLNQTVFPDATTNITGEAPSWPIIEGRTAWTIGPRGKGCLPIVVGVSGHIGEEQYNYTGFSNVRRRTWSGNVDVRVPLTENFGVQAEAFMGSNLDAFLGGIGQGIDSVSRDAIRSRGGWVEVWYDWTPRLHSHIGYSIDDPNDQDLSVATERSFNQFYWGNISFDVTKQLLMGLEVSSWKTLYVGQLPGNAVRTEFMVKYVF